MNTETFKQKFIDGGYECPRSDEQISKLQNIHLECNLGFVFDKDSQTYLRKILRLPYTYPCSMKMANSILLANMLVHKSTRETLVEWLNEEKQIHLDSFFLNMNSSKYIKDGLLEEIRKNHRSIARKATPSNISLIEKELNYNSDLFYYYVNALEWKHVKRSYLVKCLAGAIA
ncbi:putative lipoprotein [Streptococcus pneumoniae]|nr:putative lipoprotein [Streptococcus pneumoniae]